MFCTPFILFKKNDLSGLLGLFLDHVGFPGRSPFEFHSWSCCFSPFQGLYCPGRFRFPFLGLFKDGNIQLILNGLSDVVGLSVILTVVDDGLTITMFGGIGGVKEGDFNHDVVVGGSVVLVDVCSSKGGFGIAGVCSSNDGVGGRKVTLKAFMSAHHQSPQRLLIITHFRCTTLRKHMYTYTLFCAF